MSAANSDLKAKVVAARQAARERLARRLESVKRLEYLHVAAVNERIAVMSTLIFGSMWMFYAFFLYGFLPLLPQLAPYQDKFLYWGSWIQLWALPLLMVGGIVLNRASERRAAEDHETLMAELAEIKTIHAELLETMQAIKRIESEVCGKPEGQ
ncbi:MAG TPA: hypothetical protein VFB21_14705 [Chthonomonadaceae bacterium]|nr:hypothetical protein [Chthonomonadaceae bacterium]